MLQQLIQPLVMGATLSLNPLVVLVVTIGAGSLFGMVGLTLAAPLTSAAVHIVDQLRDQRKARRPSRRCRRRRPQADVRRHRRPTPGSGLHQCVLCHAEYVVPVRWDEDDDDHWKLLLRCAECETYREVVVANDVAKRYELDLERGMAEIASTLKRLDRLRMIALLDTFIAALERDLIDAADFAPR